MSHELICEWLGLAAETWPPDHYRLLGLAPGESDAERIEQRVHERLEAVRHYQMAHPEQATEAMNRLAQAYVCLTDASSKRAYDAVLFGTAAPVAVAVAEAPAAQAERPDPLAWLFGPAGVPRLVVGHAAAVAAPAPPAARPTRTDRAGRDGGSGRANRCRRRRRPAVAEGAPRPGHQAGLVRPGRRHAANCCTSGSGWASTSSRPAGG